MHGGKEAVLSKLLSGSGGTVGERSRTTNAPLISEVKNTQNDLISEGSNRSQISAGKDDCPQRASSQVNDGPTILEMMMEAQNAAKKESDAQKERDRQKDAATAVKGSSGFKKGFFGKVKTGNSEKKKGSVVTTVGGTTNNNINNNKESPIHIKAHQPSAVKDRSSKSLILDEVQKAMEEEAHPLLQQLSKNDWVNDDLMAHLQSNSLLSAGLRDPECMAAVQLMQQNPQQAKQKFQGNPKVTRFLQEFGAVMAKHFEALGEKTTSSSSAAASTTSASSSVLELGPLQAQALSKAQKQQQASAGGKIVELHASQVSKAKSKDINAKSESSNAHIDEQQRVQQVLQDEELREMLMDAKLQQILVECGDPEKFRQHMQNPEVARKIVRLQQSGLVRSER